tara:strand:+ start:18154 stop:18921 length:768 start_codon:yes stop_codon:yes gene_type:complete
MKNKMNDKDYNWVPGIHAVRSALKHGQDRIKRIAIDSEKKDKRIFLLKKEALRKGIEILETNSNDLSNLSGGTNHQGILALTTAPTSMGEKELDIILSEISGSKFLLVLDGITDPQNLGACLRVADGAGVNAVIAPKDNCVGLTPTVCKVASGAVETIPYIQVTNLARTMRYLQDVHKVFFYGASERGEEDIYNTDLTGSLAIVMGGEGKGIRRLTLDNCDFTIKLPMFGALDSLNVSVATGICLYEAVRQRATH